MDNEKNFSGQSMDEIVFDNRNKSYGAYNLRVTYQKHLLKALGISFSLFIFGIYTPKMAKAIGLFPDKPICIGYIDTIEWIDPFLKIDLKEKEKKVKKDGGSTDADLEIEATKEKTILKQDTSKPIDNTAVIVTNPGGTGIGDDLSGGSGGSGTTKIDSSGPEAPEIADEPPQFIGGEEALEKFLRKHLKYPIELQEAGVEGETLISFVVTSDGRVLDVKIASTSGNDQLDEEASKVIKKTNKMFTPGKRKGKPVSSFCRIPITFGLID